ncbi:MAG TPA: D-alanine--D-alanine ligase [Solirubrobacteraceae bacterium]|nr:D-alanine--D-alanine ligase [Solirubrobacteraceae bacterium]
MNERRVAVAKGGTSIEREVSLRGAHRVTAALRQAGYEVNEVEIDHTVLDRVREVAPAFVFIVAHGRNGEDGSLQALLELLHVPYTGSDSLSSALCIDKILTKRLLQRAGLPTPPFHAFSRRTFQDLGAATVFDDVMASLGAPVVVKPARMGSSFGIKFVSHRDQLRTAVLGSVAYDDEILVEQHVAGRELAVTVIGGAGPADPEPPRALPIVEIFSTREFYDYEAHYDFDVVRLAAPAELDDGVRAAVEAVSLEAYCTLGCRDFARVDLMLDGDSRPQILEINTIPGLTETGPTPYAADAAGMTFAELVASIARRATGDRSTAD